MKLEHESPGNLKKEILQIVGKYLDLQTHKIFFFGSRVSGTGSERSDIDVGIDGPSPIPFEILSAITEEVDDLPILYKIDLVDFQRASEDFRDVALQQIELLTV